VLYAPQNVHFRSKPHGVQSILWHICVYVPPNTDLKSQNVCPTENFVAHDSICATEIDSSHTDSMRHEI
jgi:hypothetical protein